LSVAMLRISGNKAKIKQFLDQTSLEIVKVYWEGEAGVLKSRGLNKTSGLNIEISRTEWAPIDIQQTEVLDFFKKYEGQMALIRDLELDAIVDFALHDKTTEEFPWPSYALSSEFIEAAGALGFGTHLSFYGLAQ
jgi:hypothetical protein